MPRRTVQIKHRNQKIRRKITGQDYRYHRRDAERRWWQRHGRFDIHYCDSVAQTPVNMRRIIATAVAISLIVPAVVVLLLAAATHLFAN